MHAGRSGDSHDDSVPLADLWSFNVHLAKWTRLRFDGANDEAPAARFLHMGAQSADKRTLYVFGGQHSTDATADAGEGPSEHAVRFNDVWRFDVVARRWEALFENRCE